MKLLIQLARLVVVLGLATWSRAQATSAASRLVSIKIGAGWTIANPDYGQRKVQGLTIYGNLDFTRHWGIEGDIHRASMVTPTDIGVDSYLLGPRYAFHYGRFSPYAKVLLGVGRFKYIFSNAPTATYTYKIYSLGGGLDYQATKHFSVRAFDFEYQKWPGYNSNGLTPLDYTFGAAYVF
ncbi:porin family protein [Edaphobacter bradus]|uniref:porin family protein n=1 Tax=Edaphobacter bradus TaxID=2259016 RepID=UPI0021E01DF3|nr:porin family protein [Edaphobacter bradus]